jgi:hypothetical protein
MNKMKLTKVFNVNPGKQGTPINFFQNQKVTATSNIELQGACYEHHEAVRRDVESKVYS